MPHQQCQPPLVELMSSATRVNRWLAPVDAKRSDATFSSGGPSCPRIPRNQQFDPNSVGILHCIQRCVRRAFLAGVDPVSGKDYSFRREWIRARMERLASVFGVDVLTYAIPLQSLAYRDSQPARYREILVRSRCGVEWLRIFPGRRIDEQLADLPTTMSKDWLKIQNASRSFAHRLSDLPGT